MGYPAPEVRGTPLRLSTKSKAYKCIQAAQSAPLVDKTFADATREQTGNWREAMNDPAKVRAEGNVPELQKELAYQTLETLRDVAISCVNRVQEHLQKALLPEEAKAIELILNIQVRCAVNVARIIEAMNKLDSRT